MTKNIDEIIDNLDPERRKKIEERVKQLIKEHKCVGGGCICSVVGLEPEDKCPVHGCPDLRFCPCCGQIRGYKACKRCGCDKGLEEIKNEEG